jgi:hypothetical protein
MGLRPGGACGAALIFLAGATLRGRVRFKDEQKPERETGMTWDGISEPGAAVWAPLRMGQVYGAKLIELGADNVSSTLEFFGELSGAKTPADFAEAVSNETRRRLDTLTEQFDELTRLFGATNADDKAANEGADDVGLGD